jgi:hypothetical protein
LLENRHDRKNFRPKFFPKKNFPKNFLSAANFLFAKLFVRNGDSENGHLSGQDLGRVELDLGLGSHQRHPDVDDAWNRKK